MNRSRLDNAPGKSSRQHSPTMYLTRVFHFSSSHRMASPHLSAEENFRRFGKCANPGGHGHNYRLEVTVAGSVDPRTGCVMNIEELARVVQKKVVEVLDHKNINKEIPHFRRVIPSMENIAHWAWKELEGEIHPARLHLIRLFETESNFVEYRGE